MSSSIWSRAVGLLAILLMAVGALFFLAIATSGKIVDGPGILVLLVGEALIFGFLALGPIGKALARLIADDQPGGRDTEQLTERLTETEYRLREVDADLLDLQERLAFTERLLSRHTDGGEL